MTDRDKRTIRIGAIVGGSMVVLVLALNFIGRGGDTDTIALPSIPVPTRTTTTTGPPTTGSGGPTTTPTGTPTTPVPVFTGRDPFSLPFIFQQTATSTSSGGSSTSTSSPPTSSPTSGSTSGSTSTSSSPGGGSSSTPTQPGNGSSTTVGGHQVVLLDTFTHNGVESAQVEVDGTVYSAAEGETFGPGNAFEVQSVSGNCAGLLFGDESFTLCTTPQK
jgi:hypothetical protein